MQKPMINGVEVKVGQKWKTREGGVYAITSVQGQYPFLISSKDEEWAYNGQHYENTPSNNDLYFLIDDIGQPKAKARVVEDELEGIVIYKLEVLQENGEYVVIASSNHKDGLIKQAELYSTVKRKVIHEVF